MVDGGYLLRDKVIYIQAIKPFLNVGVLPRVKKKERRHNVEQARTPGHK